MAKNNLKKYMELKGARLRDVVFFLRDSGIECSRQHIHAIMSGRANPREMSPVRKGLCDFFGVDDPALFGEIVFKEEIN